MKTWMLPAALLLAPAAAAGATLEISVIDAAGRPVRDAVVLVESAAGKTRMPPRPAGPLRVVQQNIQFDPFVLIVPLGAEVVFPNRDKVRHHVYSFSKPKKFELKLYGREDARTVTFDKLGAVALGCNIHDGMRAFIRVVDTPFAVKTDAAGRALVPDLPRGPAKVIVWHPYARSQGNEIALPVALAPTGKTTRSVRLNILRRG